MSNTITTVHGHSFTIDTMDWTDEKTRARVEDGLDSIVRGWTPEQAAEHHRLLSAAAEGDVEWDHPILTAIEDACGAVVLRETADWASLPNVGHNAEIAAA